MILDETHEILLCALMERNEIHHGFWKTIPNSEKGSVLFGCVVWLGIEFCTQFSAFKIKLKLPLKFCTLFKLVMWNVR